MPSDPAQPTGANRTRFAFCGRTATPDPLGRTVARVWELARAALLIEPAAGEIVVEYFDTAAPPPPPGCDARANDLLAALADSDRSTSTPRLNLTMHIAIGLCTPTRNHTDRPQSS